MTRLKFFLLGPPQAEGEVGPLEIKRRKVLALLIYLAVTGETQPRDTLATLFWPEADQRQARAALRRRLSELHDILGGTWLQAERERVGLQPGFWLDLKTFEQKLAAAQKHDHPAAEDCPTCLEHLISAAGLYRGEFLAGFTLPDCPDFDEWQFFQAEALRQQAATVLERLIHLYRVQNEPVAAIPYAQKWLSLDPLHEPAHCQLMLLYAETGRQAAALRQYQLCLERLQAELDLSPTAETTRLYEQIKAGELGRGLGEWGDREMERWGKNLSSAPPLPRSLASLHNLPAQLTPLLGREQELIELAQLLNNSEIRLLTIVGPGGIGKTHLAIEAARNQLDQFPHGVYFVSLASIETLEALVVAIAEALNFSFYREGPPQQQLIDYLRQKRLLLVLDNFEQLLDLSQFPPVEGTNGGLEVVVELLRQASGLKVLVTSRARLKLQGEQIFPLEGLTLPQASETNYAELSSQEASRYSAIRLFVQSARRLRPDFELTGEQAPAVIQICRLLQGMPLGILLAATWIELFQPSEIARQIDQNLDFLAGDWRDLPERQRSLRAVFDHSWRLLAEREQDIFQQLSVFRGGFSYEAAQAVTGATLPELRGLVNKSLLRYDRTGRYELHELLRQYGAEKLAKQLLQISEIRDRHSSYYCAFLYQHEANLKGSRQQVALAEIEADHENAHAAWRWAVEQGQVKQLRQAVDCLGLFNLWRGRFQQGEMICRIAAEKLIAALPGEEHAAQIVVEAPKVDSTTQVLAKILTWQSIFNRHLGATDVAHHLLQQALSLLDSPTVAYQDIRAEKALILLQLGRLVSVNHEKATEFCEQSLALYRALGDQWRMAEVLRRLGEVHRYLGHYHKARQCQEEGLTLRQMLGDSQGVAESLKGLGLVAKFQGRIEEAERLHRESLALYRRMDDQSGIASGLQLMSSVLNFGGKFTEAQSLAVEGIQFCIDLGYRGCLALSFLELTVAESHLGDYKQAQANAQKALTLFHEIGDLRGIGWIFSILGELALAEENYVEAQRFLQECLTNFQKIGERGSVGVALASLGHAMHRLGDLHQAQQYLAKGLQIATEKESIWSFWYLLPVIALLMADRGQKEQAVELYALVCQSPMVANSRWFEDVVGRHIAAAAATLPPEVVLMAQERGRAREVWATVEELLVELERWGGRDNNELRNVTNSLLS